MPHHPHRRLLHRHCTAAGEHHEGIYIYMYIIIENLILIITISIICALYDMRTVLIVHGIIISML